MPDNRIVIHAGECLFAQFPRIIFIGSSRASPRSASPDACGKFATSVLPGGVGAALGSIRERRLYKEKGYKTFEAYCREVWGWGANYAGKQIKAARAVEEMGTNVPVAPPAIEAHARPLARIENPQERAEVWEEVVEEAAAEQRPVTAIRVSEKRDGNSATVTEIAPQCPPWRTFRRHPTSARPARWRCWKRSNLRNRYGGCRRVVGAWRVSTTKRRRR
jgi:hypothetical protein